MKDIPVPLLSESITSGTVVSVNVKPGDVVGVGTTLIEIETEKAVLEVPSPLNGTIKEVLVVKGDVVSVGQVISRAEENERQVARELKPEIIPQAERPQEGEEYPESMTATRHTIAAQMARSWTTIPHVTHFFKADITELEKIRQRYKEEGRHLSVMPFIIKIVAEALVKFPYFNATVNMEEKTIVCKNVRNIGIAVDTPHGLIVPVIHDADKKSVVRLAEELEALATHARNRQLSPEQLRGGTFTITNLGGITRGSFAPIIKIPEVAILGIGRAESEPRYVTEESLMPRLMLPLSLSYDHRVNDGANAGRFIKYICIGIESPNEGGLS